MITIQSVSAANCYACLGARKVLEETKVRFPNISTEEIDISSPKGIELVQKYNIFASPGIIINGALFSSGNFDKRKFLEKIEELL